MPTEKKVSRLFVKVASAINEIGPVNFERHLDNLISRKEINNSRQKNPVIDCVIRVVSEHFSITQVELRKGYGEKASFALSIAYFEIKNRTKLNLIDIAKYFGRTTHSGVSRKFSEINELNPTDKFDKEKHFVVQQLTGKIDIEVKKIKKQ